MGILGSTKNKKTKDKNGENVSHLVCITVCITSMYYWSSISQL